MNFEDPFANDLKNFGSVMSGIGARRGAPPMQSMPAANAPFGPNPFVTGAGAAASSGPPVAGRRAGGGGGGAPPSQPAVGGVGSAFSGAVGPRSQAAAQPSAAPAAPPPVSNELSWLDDPPPLPPPPQQRRAAAPAPVQAASSALPPWAAAAAPSAPPADDDPFGFLSGPSSGAAAASGGLMSMQQNVSAAAPPQQSAQEAEIKDLRSSLLALELELGGVEEKLETREIKEEAELMELATTVMEKKCELERQEETLADKCEEVKKATTKRLDGMHQRYADELTELEAEVRNLEGTRLQRQVQQLQQSIIATDKSLTELHRQRALSIEAAPYTKQGILLSLSAAEDDADKKSKASSSASTKKTSRRSSTGSDRGSGSDSSPDSDKDSRTDKSSSVSILESEVDKLPPLELALSTAVSIMQRYHEERIGAIKDNIVDYLHDETVSAAHDSRARHGLGLIQEAIERKSQFAVYIEDMMTRCVESCRQRATLKQQNMHALYEEVQSSAARLRSEAVERLEKLKLEVAAKHRLALERFEVSASESRDAMQRQAAFTDEGDRAMASAQQSEAESRCQTERSVRHKLWSTECDTLREQLTRLRAGGDRLDAERWRELKQTASSCGEATGMTLLQSQLSALRTMTEELTEDERSRRSGMPFKRRRIADPAALEDDVKRMTVAEATHTIQLLLKETECQQEKLTHAWVRCRELRDKSSIHLEEAVEALLDRRLSQQAKQAALDFVRCAWEREHRENLSAAFQLEVPVAGDIDVSMGIETRLAPADMTALSLLQLVADKVRHRHTTLTQVRSKRGEAITKHRSDVKCLCDAHATIKKLNGVVDEKHSTLRRTHEALLVQQLSVYREALLAESERDAIEGEREALQSRRALIEAQTAAYKAEGDSVLDGYETHKARLQVLSEEQLNLAEEHHRIALQQQQQQQQLQKQQQQQQQLQKQQVDMYNSRSPHTHRQEAHSPNAAQRTSLPAQPRRADDSQQPFTAAAAAAADTNCTPPQMRAMAATAVMAADAAAGNYIRAADKSSSSSSHVTSNGGYPTIAPKGILQDDNRMRTSGGREKAQVSVYSHKSTAPGEGSGGTRSSSSTPRRQQHAMARVVAGSPVTSSPSTFIDLITIGNSTNSSSS